MFKSYIYHPQKNTLHQIVECLSFYHEYNPVKFIENIAYVKIGNYQKNVIYCYGNAGSILRMIHHAKEYSRKNKVNIIIFDYPGYGISGGSPSEQNNTYALKRVIDEFDSVELIGESIGTGVVLSYMAHYQGYKVNKIYLISPFLSIINVVTNSEIIEMIFSLLSNDIYDNIWNIQFVKCPIEIYTLKSDEIVPSSHGRKLFSRIRNQRCDNKFLELNNPDCDHGMVGFLCLSHINL